MCGINGFLQFKQKLDKEKMHDMVHKMNEKIVHRGPDAEGIYVDERCAFGMRRLSVIDLQGGIQPIWNEGHDKLIIFNGELYNFKSLRKMLQQKGHIFTTESDTEVALHGFESEGISFFKQMEGMFSLAIYDVKDKKCIIARDRIGEKPLYYFLNKDFLLFASELKSIFSTNLIEKEIDKEALSQYFQLKYIPAPKTIIKNIYKLMPATVLMISEDGSFYSEQYWKLDVDQEEDEYKDYNLCKKKLREALYRSVEQKMISDVPLGAFLSGGFDSAIIVGIMAHISSTPINTFTIGFREKQYDESGLAKLIAEKNKTNHHVLILDWENIFVDLDLILANMDEPFADASLISTYAVSKLAKEYVTVALTGDAGDELFAGYDKYLISYYGERYQKVPAFLRKMVIEPGVKLLPQESNLARKANKVIRASDLSLFEQRKQLMCLGFKGEELGQLMSDGVVDEMKFIKDIYFSLKNRDEQLQTQYVDLKVVLEGDMLAKVDRASMLASLETRVPMLDSDVVELAFKMPTHFKMNGRDRKIILKETFHELLPEKLFHMPKHGFGVPIGKWLETAFREKLNYYASFSFLQEQKLFSYQYINEIMKAHMSHKEDRSSELWTFFVFQHWYEHNIMET